MLAKITIGLFFFLIAIMILTAIIAIIDQLSNKK